MYAYIYTYYIRRPARRTGPRVTSTHSSVTSPNCGGKVPYCTSCASFPQALSGKVAQLVRPTASRTPDSRSGVEEKGHNWYSTALFLYASIISPFCDLF